MILKLQNLGMLAKKKTLKIWHLDFFGRLKLQV